MRGPCDSHIDNTSIAEAKMVSEVSGNIGGGSNFIASISGSVDTYSYYFLATKQLMLVAWKISGLGSLQEAFRRTLLPVKIVDTTHLQRPQEKWVGWCSQRKSNAIQASVANAANLKEQLQRGLKYFEHRIVIAQLYQVTIQN